LPPGAPAAMPNDSKPIVLVADDEPSMVAMLSSHLRSKGYTVLEASDGDQAWELAHEHLPNLVLLDVMMPGMSGWEVCRKIREAVSLAHTGVIMLTGIGENLNEMTSPLYGADAYLDKPFEFSDLDQKISETIARREDGALGRADGDNDAGLVKKALQAVTKRKAAKPKPVAEKEPEMPAEEKAAPKPKKAPAAKPDIKPEAAKNGPKPALAKAVARPAPKLEKPVAKTKVKAKPPVKAPAPKAAKPAPKPAKPAPKAAKATKPVAKAKKSAKPAPKIKPKKKAAPPTKAAKPAAKAAKAAKKPAKPAKKSAKPAPSKPVKKAPKPTAKAVKSAAKASPKPAKKSVKKR
jgi:DNA-binding response OmpR family regulator